MTNKIKMQVVYGVAAILNMGLVALYGQVMAGHVPFPVGWEWLVPVLAAVLVGATSLLPKLSDVPHG